MSRPPTGQITAKKLDDGTLAFQLRFRAYGAREHETLHERRGCDCGCRGGWTEATAQVELDNILARVKVGVWRKREATVPTAAAVVRRAPTLHEYASEWAARWQAGEFGDPPDEDTIADYIAWRLPKLILPTRLLDGTQMANVPVDDEHLTRRLCGAFKAALIRDRDALARDLAAGADIRDRQGRRRRPLSNRSIQMGCTLLGQILEQAVADEMLTANPARGKHMTIKLAKPLRTFLELDEVADLIDAAAALDPAANPKTDQIKALRQEGRTLADIARIVGFKNPSTVHYHVSKPRPAANVEARSFLTALTYGGMRISEALDRRERDVRLHAADPRVGIPDSKTPTGVREVDISDVMRDELLAWRAARHAAGIPAGPNAFIWPQPDGRQRSETWARKLLARAVALADERRDASGLQPLPQPVTPHSLRRTYISILLLASRGDIPYVMAQVGHADARTTTNIYMQLLKRQKREHGQAFDALIERAREVLHGTPLTLTDPAEDADGAAIGQRIGQRGEFGAATRHIREVGR